MKSFALLIVCLIAHTIQASDVSGAPEWRAHKARYNLSLNQKEDADRFAIFSGHFKSTQEHNAAQIAGGQATHRLGLTPFSHLTNEEFQKRFSMQQMRALKRPPTPKGDPVHTVEPAPLPLHTSHPAVTKKRKASPAPTPSSFPASLDWRTVLVNGTSVVSAVQDQGSCGSCWAFSASEVMRSCNVLKNASATKSAGLATHHFSAQQLVDCSTLEGNEGCNGGLPVSAYQFTIKNHGLALDTVYPYITADGTCRQVAPVATVAGYVEITPNNPQALMEALQVQPVSVVIEASSPTFQNYVGGIINGGCGVDWDHAVVIVGYGVENNVPYWTVKNSWGPSWGENGYFRILRNTVSGGEGMCAIQALSSRPTC